MTFFSIYSFNLTFQNFKIHNLGIKSGHIKSEWQERKPKKPKIQNYDMNNEVLLKYNQSVN